MFNREFNWELADKIKHKIAQLECKPWSFRVDPYQSSQNYICIKAEKPVKDVYTGNPVGLNTIILINEIHLEHFAQIIHDTLISAKIHEFNENFMWENQRIFNPHKTA
jgi:hypothetical protein